MNLTELKKMVKEEYTKFLEQDMPEMPPMNGNGMEDPTIAVSENDIDLEGTLVGTDAKSISGKYISSGKFGDYNSFDNPQRKDIDPLWLPENLVQYPKSLVDINFKSQDHNPQLKRKKIQKLLWGFVK